MVWRIFAAETLGDIGPRDNPKKPPFKAVVTAAWASKRTTIRNPARNEERTDQEIPLFLHVQFLVAPIHGPDIVTSEELCALFYTVGEQTRCHMDNNKNPEVAGT